ncbi:MAG TPA: hypothetical protein VJJ20_04005 [Candidatus Paceibacterota bacterium]
MKHSKQYMGTADPFAQVTGPASPSELIEGWKAQAKKARTQREFGGHSEQVVAESLARARAICGERDLPSIPLSPEAPPSQAVLADTRKAEQLSLNF